LTTTTEKKTAYQFLLGSFPKYSPYYDLVPGPGVSAGFTWGLVLSASHPTPQSLLFILDLGVYGSMMRFDRTVTDYTTRHYTGFFRYLQAHAGPRFDILLPFSRNKSLPFDCMISTWLHCNIAVMHFEETVDSLYFRDRTPSARASRGASVISFLCSPLILKRAGPAVPRCALTSAIGNTPVTLQAVAATPLRAGFPIHFDKTRTNHV
jgi:hypothetical protein